MDPDEPVYGQVAHEMATTGDWLTPRYLGKPWFDKPPMFYWLSALSVKALGPTETACRLPSAALAVGLCLLTGMLASKLAGRRAHWPAVLAQATCVQHLILARSAVTDMTLAFFLTAALLCYAVWRQEGNRLLWMFLCGAAMGGAVLTKGPVGLLLPCAVFGLDMLLGRKDGLLRPASLAAGVGTALVVSLPWYQAMLHLHGQAFVQGFLVANNLTRFMSPEHPKSAPFYYFPPVLLAFFFPWSAYLVGAIRHCLASGDRPAVRLLLLWSGVICAFFSLSQTKLVTYIFPIYPALSALVGLFWADAGPDTATSMRRAAAGTVALGILAAGFLLIMSHRSYPPAFPVAVAIAACLAVSSAAAFAAVRRKGFALAFGTTVAMMLGFIMTVSNFLLPAIQEAHTMKAQALMAKQIARGPVYAYRLKSQSLLFYTDGHVLNIQQEQDLCRLLKNREPMIVIALRNDFARLLPRTRSHVRTISASLRYVVFCNRPAGRPAPLS